jgi:hypothetical protein
MDAFTRITYFLAGVVLIYMGVVHSTGIYPYARGGFYVYSWVGWAESPTPGKAGGLKGCEPLKAVETRVPPKGGYSSTSLS